MFIKLFRLRYLGTLKSDYLDSVAVLLNLNESLFTPIAEVFDTACGVAMHRAIESERPNAHFRDPFARILAGERGAEIVQRMGGSASGLAIVVRTCVIDRLILQSIDKGVDTVLNLGAGLDTRPYRLPLPASLRWIEVDLPALLDYKALKLMHETPSCALESVRLDLAEVAARKKLLTQVGAQAKQVLVLTEGLLIYLSPEQVATLARDLHTQLNFCWWLTDLSSPLVLKLVQRKWEKHLAAKVKLQFAPQEGAKFFQQYGWGIHQFYSFLQEADHLDRGTLFDWFLRQLPWFKQDGIVLLESLKASQFLNA